MFSRHRQPPALPPELLRLRGQRVAPGAALAHRPVLPVGQAGFPRPAVPAEVRRNRLHQLCLSLRWPLHVEQAEGGECKYFYFVCLFEDFFSKHFHCSVWTRRRRSSERVDAQICQLCAFSGPAKGPSAFICIFVLVFHPTTSLPSPIRFTGVKMLQPSTKELKSWLTGWWRSASRTGTPSPW